MSKSSFAPQLRFLILLLISVLAFSSRLYSVLRSMKATKYLVNNGFYDFLNWFDITAWYPLGRVVGGTLYPGLMVTAGLIWKIANLLHIPVKIRNVCVFLAPLFSALTALSSYSLGAEISDKRTGLIAAFLMSVVPGYVSRSVAGSYDNEGVAIFALIFTFQLWIKAAKTGRLLWSTITAIAYFYMVAAWGGYVFIINIVPIHVLALTIMGRLDKKLYVAYSQFYAIGTLFSFQVPFIGFQPVMTSEHMGALGVFGLIQLVMFYNYMSTLLPKKEFEKIIQVLITFSMAAAAMAFLFATMTGYLAPWGGRLYSLLDPTWAKDNIPIIASVSEHQPTTWASFFFDLHILTILMPVGLYFSFQHIHVGTTFLILYTVFISYFSGVMVRLMLVLAPIACQMGAVGLSATMRPFFHMVKHGKDPTSSQKHGSRTIGLVALAVIGLMMIFYGFHCAWVTSEAYSSPSIVLAARGHDGHRVIIDDFREAYFWLAQNTPVDTRLLNWWDYSYQLLAMSNRSTLVDNNTWNDTHIGSVGKVLVSTEQGGIELVRDLDVDYIMLIFGGVARYNSDDIAKLIWPVRISSGVYPEVEEKDYYSKEGHYRIDEGGSSIFHNSLAFKMCYYDFAKISPNGHDPIRNAAIPPKMREFNFKYYEEAFTSSNWIVRLYKVLPPGKQINPL